MAKYTVAVCDDEKEDLSFIVRKITEYDTHSSLRSKPTQIEAENKHLTVEKREKYRFIGICLAGFDVILAAINIVPYLKFATVYYFSKWAVVVFALIPCFTRKIRK